VCPARRTFEADDKRQAAELIEFDGGDWARARRHSRGHMASLLMQAAPGPAPQRGVLLGDAGAFGLRALTLRKNEKSRPLGALPPCGRDMVAWKGRPLWLDSERFRPAPRTG
jgi:hypothetical protein